MNAQQPPPYGQPAPNDQDEDEAKMSVLWGRIQGFFILVALIITLAELGLVVQNRGLAHKALGMAKGADGTATDQFNKLEADVTRMQKGLAEVTENVNGLQSGFVNVTDKVNGLQKGLANLTENVDGLQSKFQVLESASASRASASASASASYYGAGVRNIPGAPLGWILVEGAVVLLL